MQIAYIFFYTIAYPYNLNTLGVPIEQKPAPGDHEFQFKYGVDEMLQLPKG